MLPHRLSLISQPHCQRCLPSFQRQTMLGQAYTLLALPMFTQRSGDRQRGPRCRELFEAVVKGLLCTIQTDKHGQIRLDLSFGFCQKEILLKTFLSFQNREPNVSEITRITRCFTTPDSLLGDLAL